MLQEENISEGLIGGRLLERKGDSIIVMLAQIWKKYNVLLRKK